jgi:hypothetical protein
MTFNWSWVKQSKDTLKASASIDKGAISLSSLKTPDKGIIKANEIKSSIDSANASISQVWRTWVSTIKPVLDSLPAGPRDNRWKDGRGLPAKIDALIYGVQGSTLFVFNDATSSIADGRYWHAVDLRPKTIAESVEDLWDALSSLSSTGSGSSSYDLEPLWAAVGHHYKDSALVSISTSLDYRTSVLETNLNQLPNDIYGNHEGFSYGFGSPLNYSVAINIDRLLKLHGIIDGWQDDPDAVNHNAVVPGSHTHTYVNIQPVPSASLTQDRFSVVATLYNDILRLRYEIQQVRGSTNWYSDVVSPWQTPPQKTSLYDHINYVGSGTASATNPHAVHYTNTGASTIFSNVISYLGMPNYTPANMPNYTSTYYVTQGNSILNAINQLDTALHTYLSSGEVIRATYNYDRSSMSESERETTPIVVTHNTGKKPILSVLDATLIEEGSSGEYISPVDLNIVHISNNEFQVWTGAAILEIIALY